MAQLKNNVKNFYSHLQTCFNSCWFFCGGPTYTRYNPLTTNKFLSSRQITDAQFAAHKDLSKFEQQFTATISRAQLANKEFSKHSLVDTHMMAICLLLPEA